MKKKHVVSKISTEKKKTSFVSKYKKFHQNQISWFLVNYKKNNAL